MLAMISGDLSAWAIKKQRILLAGTVLNSLFSVS